MIGRFSFGIGLVICLALQGVRAGAVEPNDQKPSPTEMKLREPTITADDRSHWSFRPLRRPAIPHVAGATAARIRNPIDCFISENCRNRVWPYSQRRGGTY